MKKEMVRNNVDMMLNKMLSSFVVFILVSSTILFVGLFFYQDFSNAYQGFKESFKEDQIQYDQPKVSIPKELPSEQHTAIMEKTAQYSETINYAPTVLERGTDEASKAAEKIFVAYELGDSALASRLVAEFLVEYPKNSLENRVRLIGAKLMFDRNDTKGALKYIQKILQDSNISAQDYSESVLLMGEIARQKKQYDSYIESFLEQAYFKSESETKSKLAFYLGYLFLNKGDFRTSLSYFNNATGEEAVLGRADLYQAQNMKPETINALENFLTQYPNSKNYSYAKQLYLKESFLLSESLMARGYFDSAERTLKKVATLFTQTADGDLARIKLAGIYYDKNQYSNAINVLSEIIANADTTHNSEALFMLGKIYFDQGMEEQSLGFFRSITEQYPHSNFVFKAREWQQLLLDSLQN